MCAPGFRLRRNKHKCKALGRTDPLLLYAASRSVNWFMLKSKRMKQVANNLNQVVGITYDGAHIYWTDISIQVESVMRSKLDGSEKEVRFKLNNFDSKREFDVFYSRIHELSTPK